MTGSTGPHYACRCLNIRIRPAACPTTPAKLEDPSFTPVFVEDDGISVVRLHDRRVTFFHSLLLTGAYPSHG